MKVEKEETPQERKQRRIAEARADLAARYAADPEGVQRFQSRMANLAAVRKRERERFERLVLGTPPEPEPMPKKPTGMSKAEWKVEKARIQKERKASAAEADRFEGKAGTPQTLAFASSTHTGSLEQLERNGTITKDQREWAAEIANVYRSIEAEVGIKVASLEARVDNDRAAGNRVAEGVKRVRLHAAYSEWRDALPPPKQMVLDMIVGDAIGYSVAAKRYRVGKLRAKRALIEALDRWPRYVQAAFRDISEDEARTGVRWWAAA
ncbi:MAG TPA: hypothetical protein VHL34_25025 [Rhizomicrobium sp.]|nr:hypothetical protein [Rhizomicrobium sp.]